MPRSPLPRRRSRSVVVRRSARLPLSGPRPLVTRYGPAEAHQQAASSAFPTQRSVPGWPAAGSAPHPAAGWPAADDEAPPTTVLAPEAVEEWAEDEWAQAEDEQPTTVFNPSGLVAWALAPDDGPPTTVLHLDLPPAEPDVPPARGSTGAHRAVSIGSLPVVPLRRLAHRNPVGLAGEPGADSTRTYPRDADAFGPRHGAAGRSPVAFAGEPGAEPIGAGAPRHGAGLDHRAGGLPRGAVVGLRGAEASAAARW